MKIDFYARRRHFMDHLVPIWDAMSAEERGTFYVSNEVSSDDLVEFGRRKFGLDVRLLEEEIPPGNLPIISAAYDDLHRILSEGTQRDVILMEHGVGLVFGTPGYAGGHGDRDRVNLFLAPNEVVRRLTMSSQPRTPQIVIGTPKLDRWAWQQGITWDTLKTRPIVAVSFHWNGGVEPEAGNAFRDFERGVIELSRSSEWTLVGHSHPKIAPQMRAFFEDLEVPFYEEFDDVMTIADVYVNDASSTMYEFLVTGKPVVIMNSSTFRRDVRWGIRFWDYTDIGPQVDDWEHLDRAIYDGIRHADQFKEARDRAVRDLYPFLGHSAGRAAGAIQEFYAHPIP